ncbi:tryptophan 2,3-dioxygenase [Rhizoctonia solani AG-1 IA]|uniref:Tryptophan 2,3-dioxygenase n=1 Tax=Thanatephorus cucumeris (strain AG1-IA) TaxID=983506 RepID=L8X527_THACA|nr:tryptophan 2,3-dioxygenase [Rhizoctonia solani AG-1 IA]
MSLTSISPVHTIRYVARAVAQVLPSVLQPTILGDIRSQPSSSSTPEASSSRTQPKFNPADYDVDMESGFLPKEPPLTRLPAAFDLWEDALDAVNRPNGVLSLGEDMSEEALSKRESSRKWRENIASAPVLSTAPLKEDVRLLRRAHHVLAFLVHFYVHSTPPAQPAAPMLVPKSLAIPLVEVSRVLGIAPVLTFADTVLWNYALIDSSKPLSTDNIRSQTLFTASTKAARDEQNFYLCCLGIEIRGIEALNLITKYQNMQCTNSPQAIAEINNALGRLCDLINDLTSILTSVRCTCDPHAFYFAIRPWFRGSDAGGPSSPGWIFEGVGDSSELELSGPSAGQSSMMHSLDVFLDIDHKLEKPRLPAPSELNKKSDRTFMQRMQRQSPTRTCCPHTRSSRVLRRLCDGIEELPRRPHAHCVLVRRFNVSVRGRTGSCTQGGMPSSRHVRQDARKRRAISASSNRAQGGSGHRRQRIIQPTQSMPRRYYQGARIKKRGEAVRAYGSCWRGDVVDGGRWGVQSSVSDCRDRSGVRWTCSEPMQVILLHWIALIAGLLAFCSRLPVQYCRNPILVHDGQCACLRHQAGSLHCVDVNLQTNSDVSALYLLSHCIDVSRIVWRSRGLFWCAMCLPRRYVLCPIKTRYGDLGFDYRDDRSVQAGRHSSSGRVQADPDTGTRSESHFQHLIAGQLGTFLAISLSFELSSRSTRGLIPAGKQSQSNHPPALTLWDTYTLPAACLVRQTPGRSVRVSAKFSSTFAALTIMLGNADVIMSHRRTGMFMHYVDDKIALPVHM